MEIQPIDLTALVSVTLGILVVLVPVIGFTVRFAIKPIADALGRSREGSGPARELELLAARVRELEEEVIQLKNTDPYRVSVAGRSEALPAGQSRG